MGRYDTQAIIEAARPALGKATVPTAEIASALSLPDNRASRAAIVRALASAGIEPARSHAVTSRRKITKLAVASMAQSGLIAAEIMLALADRGVKRTRQAVHAAIARDRGTSDADE